MPAAKTPTTRFNEAEMRLCLTHLAKNRGNAAQAKRDLDEVRAASPGLLRRVPDYHTLRGWMEEHGDLYHEVRRDILPEINDRIVANEQEFAALVHEKEVETIELYDPKALKPNEVSKSLRDLSTSKGISLSRSREIQQDRVGAEKPKIGFEEGMAALAKMAKDSEHIREMLGMDEAPKFVEAEVESDGAATPAQEAATPAESQ
jgi:hypothetical protein